MKLEIIIDDADARLFEDDEVMKRIQRAVSEILRDASSAHHERIAHQVPNNSLGGSLGSNVDPELPARTVASIQAEATVEARCRDLSP